MGSLSKNDSKTCFPPIGRLSVVSIERYHNDSVILNFLFFGRLAVLLKRGETRKELDWHLCVLLVSQPSTFTSASCKIT